MESLGDAVNLKHTHIENIIEAFLNYDTNLESYKMVPTNLSSELIKKLMNTCNCLRLKNTKN